VTGLVCALACAHALGQRQHVAAADLADLSLEELATVTVTSVSRREERLVDAPAAIFVVTAEDIRRSGAASLYEALRLAPNLQVVRGDTSQYIGSARGGLAGTANRMLVLIDGRTVYSPLFSGVFSDSQFVFLEDVERIEVISGPGSTLWGTNAVNGVINVITKSAAKTRGTLAFAGGGDDESGAGARHATTLAGGDLRAYAHYVDQRAHALASGASAQDDADHWLAGVRFDKTAGRHASTLMGEMYGANANNLAGARPLSGGHVLGRWQLSMDDGARLFAQAYYDRTEREHTGSFAEKRDTFDVEVNHSRRPAAGHELVVGGGYRSSHDRTQTTAVLGFLPAERTLVLASLYAQDQWQITPKLTGTLGLRAEHNSYTGVEWLPNARLAYSMSPDHVVWSALTRAVRSPSRLDRELVVPGAPPYVLVPGDFESEIANVAELGYRARVTPGATVSFTAFYHQFRKLHTLAPGTGGLVFANGGEGRLTGLEGWGDFALMPQWRLVWGFVLMRERFNLREGAVDLAASRLGNDPKQTFQLRSLWNVSPAWEVDLGVRYMGELPAPVVPSYTVADARLGWHVTRNLDLSLLVSNVFDKVHREFADATVGAVFGRSVFLKATWRS
jgi:iron complex outermembrane receptor protein